MAALFSTFLCSSSESISEKLVSMAVTNHFCNSDFQLNYISEKLVSMAASASSRSSKFSLNISEKLVSMAAYRLLFFLLPSRSTFQKN